MLQYSSWHTIGTHGWLTVGKSADGLDCMRTLVNEMFYFISHRPYCSDSTLKFVSPLAMPIIAMQSIL